MVDFSKFDASFATLKTDTEAFIAAAKASDATVQAEVDARQAQVDALDAEVKAG